MRAMISKRSCAISSSRVVIAIVEERKTFGT
jgi:hypothetical protein